MTQRSSPDPTFERTMKLRSHLLVLSVVTMIPVLTLAIAGGVLMAKLEAVQSYVPYARSPSNAWSAAFAAPGTSLTAGAHQGLWLFAIGTAAATILSLLFAWTLSRRIAAPIASLCAQAHDPGAISRTSSVSEVAQLRDDLYAAAVAVRERDEWLRAADRAKEEFLGMLGHELRNPLAALKSSAHRLKVAGQNREIAGRAQAVIERQVGHMARLVNDLLDVTRVTSGKIRLSTKPLDLGALIEHMVQAWRDSGRFEHHDISIEPGAVWVQADQTRMEQILSNLLDNALKYTPAGGRISVRVYRTQNHAALEVRDTGQGLPPKLIHNVFDLFVQGERSLDRQEGGLGIGLTLVRRLAEVHEGSVQAASPGIGQGATFTVRLPAIDPPAQKRRASAPYAAPGHGRRVLLVEDNADARQALAMLLELEGHEVREAQDGLQGIELAEAGNFDVALVDIGLPGVDGHEVARRLRQSPAGARLFLVALTGYGGEEDRQRSRAAGFDEHLTKPVEPEQLERLLEKLAA